MKEEEKIEIGDKVVFNFSRGNKIIGKVLYVPASSGDNWILRKILDEKKEGIVLGEIVYIKDFETIHLKEKNKNKKEEEKKNV
jgi:regulator of RNase E activity RraA